MRPLSITRTKIGFTLGACQGVLNLTTTLIVLAHPDKHSFNGSWASATGRAAKAAGHSVLLSDLASMEFDPAESARHYPDFLRSGTFDPLKAQEDAAEADILPAAVGSEIDKLRRADFVVFHFPMWWFSPPALLKGWFDRVFAHGAMHDVDHRFDSGLCLGKRALFCVTTGSSEAESAFNGKEGDVQMLLWPSAYTLRYLGFTVLKHEIVHGVHGYHRGARLDQMKDRLRAALENQGSLIANFEERPFIEFNADSDFEPDGGLKTKSPSHSWFIRHKP